jgi:hypothetical protein
MNNREGSTNANYETCPPTYLPLGTISSSCYSFRTLHTCLVVSLMTTRIAGCGRGLAFTLTATFSVTLTCICTLTVTLTLCS